MLLFKSIFPEKLLGPVFLMMVVLAVAANLPLLSQPVPPAGAPAETAAGAQSNAPAAEQPVHDGGPAVMAEAGQFHLDPTAYVMLLLANLIIVVTVERLWVLTKNKGRNDELVRVLTERLHQHPATVQDLADQVSAKRFGLAGRVAAITLKGWPHSEEAMQEYTSTALMAEKRNLERRLVILSTLGNNTPFIGLLGTVLGIMKAFRDLALQGDAGPAVVMKGISEALVATAFGLAVAIPCVIAYNGLAKAVKDRLSAAEEISRLITAIRLSTKSHVPGGNGRMAVAADATA